MMTSMSTRRSLVVLVLALAWACWIAPAAAAEKRILSPIIHVDRDKGYIMVSGDSGVITVEASKEAKPHLSKLPPSGMINLVVEVRKGKHPLLKTWKVARGDTTCPYFNGKACKGTR